MRNPSTIDPARCPLCGVANVCAMETERVTGVKQGPCWCMKADIDEGILQRIPDTARDVACICARCAAPVGR